MSKESINLVAYCGLFCPRCYKMMISKAADDLNKELGIAEDKGASFFSDYPELKSILYNLIRLRCSRFCREGSAKSSSCEIRTCCVSKGYEGCWECRNFEKCEKLKDQFVKNIKEIKEDGIDGFIRKNKQFCP